MCQKSRKYPFFLMEIMAQLIFQLDLSSRTELHSLWSTSHRSCVILCYRICGNHVALLANTDICRKRIKIEYFNLLDHLLLTYMPLCIQYNGSVIQILLSLLGVFLYILRTFYVGHPPMFIYRVYFESI